MRKVRMWFAALASSSLLFAGFSAPASAQPIVTGGLVNITIVDVLNNNEILSNNDVNLGVALNVAANVCDVNVNVLAVQLRNGGATCSTGEQMATITQTTG
jgi:hypothetical protein